jgi:hypothetical protein
MNRKVALSGSSAEGYDSVRINDVIVAKHGERHQRAKT